MRLLTQITAYVFAILVCFTACKQQSNQREESPTGPLTQAEKSELEELAGEDFSDEEVQKRIAQMTPEQIQGFRNRKNQNSKENAEFGVTLVKCSGRGGGYRGCSGACLYKQCHKASYWNPFDTDKYCHPTNSLANPDGCACVNKGPPGGTNATPEPDYPSYESSPEPDASASPDGFDEDASSGYDSPY